METSADSVAREAAHSGDSSPNSADSGARETGDSKSSSLCSSATANARAQIPGDPMSFNPYLWAAAAGAAGGVGTFAAPQDPTEGC